MTPRGKRQSTTPMSSSWAKQQELVLFRINEQSEKLDQLGEKVDSLVTSMALLRWKVGAVSALIGSIFSAAISWVQWKK